MPPSVVGCSGSSPRNIAAIGMTDVPIAAADCCAIGASCAKCAPYRAALATATLLAATMIDVRVLGWLFEPIAMQPAHNKTVTTTQRMFEYRHAAHARRLA